MSATPPQGRAGSADSGSAPPNAIRGPLRVMLLVAMVVGIVAMVIALVF
jgi:hypothetical protein